MSSTGFTILLECCEVPEDYLDEESLLKDAVLLLNARWGLNGYVEKDPSGKWWGWVSCSRFLVSDATVQRALGEMWPQFINYTKGPQSLTLAEAQRLAKLRARWNVSTGSAEEERSNWSGGSGGDPSWFKKLKK